ncbi:hypothetical protein HELRODRAFT_188191, partial [Helobdella robusta]|uniref:Major facilitator superfamily (MFS) profile domain-containing protein n=1 Tax=Helobdella robusta TaxID=6412 RepID=T1FPR5_HELRO
MTMFIEETYRDEHLLGKKQRILLELSTVLYFFAKNAAVPLSQEIIYHFVARKHNMTMDSIDEFTRKLHQEYLPERNSTHPTNDLTFSETRRKIDVINEESSIMAFYLTIAELLPTTMFILLFGFYSDFTGNRRFMMYLPCLGTAVYTLGFLFPFYLFDGNMGRIGTKVILITTSIVSGMSGNISGYLCGNASYISDTDSVKRRTLRLAIVEFSIGITFALTSLLNGFWINKFGSLDQPLWFIFICSLAPFVILFFFVQEPNGSLTSDLDDYHPNLTLKETIKKIFNFRHIFHLRSLEQKKMWLMFVGFIVYSFAQQGQERVFVLYLKGNPFLWDSIQIGLFLFTLYGLSGISSWPGVPLLQKCIGDVSIFFLAIASKFLGSLLLGLSTNSGEVYGAAVVQLFHLLPYAVGRSLISQLVGHEEQGSVYAVLHSVLAVVMFLGPLCHTYLYTLTMSSMPGMVFIISGVFLAIPFTTTAWAYFLDPWTKSLKSDGYSNIDDLPVSTTP